MRPQRQQRKPRRQFRAHFNGPDYVPERDHARLTGQLNRVFNAMKDSKWRTLNEIADITGDPVASISAQLRHLRKARFGGHTVEREHVGNGLYRYRVLMGDHYDATRWR
jgi:hypothetical protein